MNEADVYREWAPPAPWRHAVACLWEQRVTRSRVHRVVPDGHADVLFHGTGAVEVVGVADAVALPELPAGTTIRGLRLRPEVVGAAFRVPASALRGSTLPGEAVLGTPAARRLGDPRHLDAWVRSIQPEPRVAAALRLLRVDRVDDVAAALSVSPRHLRRLVLQHVGLTPTTFRSVLRFQRFVRAADRGAPLAAAASEAGYADQPHCSREVRRFAELTPAQLVRQRSAAVQPAADGWATPACGDFPAIEPGDGGVHAGSVTHEMLEMTFPR